MISILHQLEGETQSQRLRKRLRYLMPSLPQSVISRPVLWVPSPPEPEDRDREQHKAPKIQGQR